MSKSYLFLAEGFEEIEALATVDVLRRSGIDVDTVSVTSDATVTGAHGIKAVADITIDKCDFDTAAWLILPGGLPGADNLYACNALTDALVKHHAAGRPIAAVCASPGVVLAPLGILRGKRATVYPGFESKLVDGGATPTGERVVIDGNVITGNGPSSAILFGLAIADTAVGSDTARQVAAGMLV